MDQLGQFIMYTVLVLIFLNVVVRVRILSSFLYILELAGFFLLYFRMFSKNVGKRSRRHEAPGSGGGAPDAISYGTVKV